MKSTKKLSILLTLLLSVCLTGTTTAQVLFDDFDNGDLETGGINGGVELIGNNQGTGPTASEPSPGSVATFTTGANSASSYGLYTRNSFDAAGNSAGFTVTFVVDSISNRPDHNGLFLGINDDDTFYRNSAMNLGFSFFGKSTEQGSAGGYSFLFNDIGSGAENILDTGADVNEASLLDGFTAEMTLDATGWAYSISGLSDGNGDATTFSNSATWENSGESATFFADTFDGSERVISSLQGNERTMEIDSYEVTAIPEPSAAGLLLGALGVLALIRRRRHAN